MENTQLTTTDNYWQMTKWQWFLEGWVNFHYAWDCYVTRDAFGYEDFWEALSWGWFSEYIFPYDDCYNPVISAERKLRLGQ